MSSSRSGRRILARSRGEHSGLGLALVKAYAGVLNAGLSATLSEANVFCISVELPAATADHDLQEAKPIWPSRCCSRP